MGSGHPNNHIHQQNNFYWYQPNLYFNYPYIIQPIFVVYAPWYHGYPMTYLHYIQHPNNLYVEPPKIYSKIVHENIENPSSSPISSDFNNPDEVLTEDDENEVLTEDDEEVMTQDDDRIPEQRNAKFNYLNAVLSTKSPQISMVKTPKFIIKSDMLSAGSAYLNAVNKNTRRCRSVEPKNNLSPKRATSRNLEIISPEPLKPKPYLSYMNAVTEGKKSPIIYPKKKKSPLKYSAFFRSNKKFFSLISRDKGKNWSKSKKRAGGLIYCKDEDEIKILIVFQTKWSLPKGQLERGETLYECASREIREETGIDISIEECNQHIVLDNMRFYFVDASELSYELKPENSEEISEVKWVTQQELLLMKDQADINFSLSIVKYNWDEIFKRLS